MTTQVVWFKRDLRVVDHRPLARAAQAGPVIALYVIEPDYWRLPDSSERHWRFVNDCLIELDQQLRGLGIQLTVCRGQVTEVLDRIERSIGQISLWSHEETGNGWTFARDRAVGHWCRAHAINWTEIPQFGVVRRLRSRNGWAPQWDQLMGEPITQAPSQLTPPTTSVESIALNPRRHEFQPGGRQAGLSTLESFLSHRGANYRAGMASPLTGFDTCSRLSPHITWGSVSMREIYHAAVRETGPARIPKAAIESFIGRLHWHCHFMQKLEDQPDIEVTEVHPAYRDLRADGGDAALWAAYERGETGYPFIDACLRALTTTGYLNFRARAMVTSFSSYQLWQPWQRTGAHLAKLFTDYEPGIHWSQIQMQSGTTGINQIRIYNPVKQGLDNDPNGQFIRRWVPELASLSAAEIHEPWRHDQGQALLGRSYPAPIVDLKTATAQARDIVWNVRKQGGFRDAADAIQSKHGSRKAGIRRPDKARAAKKSTTPSPQLDLEL